MAESEMVYANSSSIFSTSDEILDSTVLARLSLSRFAVNSSSVTFIAARMAMRVGDCGELNPS